MNWTPIEIEIGQRVLLQDRTSKAYDIPGKVVRVRPGGRSAYIEANGGKTYLRNRRFFRIDPLYNSPALDAAKVVIVETVGSHPQSTSCFKRLFTLKRPSKSGSAFHAVMKTRSAVATPVYYGQ